MPTPSSARSTGQPPRRSGDRARCPCRPAPPTKKTQIIAIYGKGGIGKSFTLANLSYMMAQQGKTRAADRLRSRRATRPRCCSAARACPTIIETSSQEEARRRGGRDRRRLLQARRRVRDGARRPGGRPRLRRPRHHPRLRAAREARLPRMGLRLRPARFPRRRGVRRLRPADRARHVPEGHRRRLERPAVALRRQQRLLGGRIFPQARRQCRRRRHGHQQGRRHRRGRRPSPKPSASRCWPRSRPTRTSAARARTTRSSASPAAAGRRCSRTLAEQRRRRAAACGRRRSTQDGLLGLFNGDATSARDVVLEPATLADMCGAPTSHKPSLEVVYDTV